MVSLHFDSDLGINYFTIWLLTIRFLAYTITVNNWCVWNTIIIQYFKNISLTSI